MKLSFQKNDNKWDVLHFNFEIFERKIDKDKPKILNLLLFVNLLKKKNFICLLGTAFGYVQLNSRCFASIFLQITIDRKLRCLETNGILNRQSIFDGLPTHFIT